MCACVYGCVWVSQIPDATPEVYPLALVSPGLELELVSVIGRVSTV